MKTTIWWIRKDIRLSDNGAFNEAIEQGDQIIPVFILDPKLLNSESVSDSRLKFMHNALWSLNQQLMKRGSRLILREGNPLVELSKLVRETKADGIFFEENYSPYAKIRDQHIFEELPAVSVAGVTGKHPRAVLKDDSTPYLVFTPFRKRWMSSTDEFRKLNEFSTQKISTPSGIPSLKIPNQWSVPLKGFPASEEEAHRRFDVFLDGPIFRYHENRDILGADGTSRLSPYLRFGLISIRKIYNQIFELVDEISANRDVKSLDIWLYELIWREFYYSILYHFPSVLQESFREKYRDLPWLNNQADFLAWKSGLTGYPIIDAAMRQLSSTGWMHNRARMVTASFLTKDLLIDWRWGEKWFMQNLVDGDPANNNGGWQWAAGVGTDAAPYFRIFNPVSQSKKFDPNGKYIKHWVKELRNVPEKFVHEPWKMDAGTQKSSECIIGKDYPHPIVDHDFARERALSFYKNNSG